MDETSTHSDTGRLLPQHQERLSRPSDLDGKPSIIEAVQLARGYESVEARSRLTGLGFQPWQARVPTLLIPQWGVDGKPRDPMHRPDKPRKSGPKRLINGVLSRKVVKYEPIYGSTKSLDTNPLCVPQMGDPEIDLWLCEGSIKCDYLVSRGFCAINISGVWAWRGTNGFGGKTALSAFNDVALNDRNVVILFDSDLHFNRNVYGAMQELYGYLKDKQAKVKVVDWVKLLRIVAAKRQVLQCQ